MEYYDNSKQKSNFNKTESNESESPTSSLSILKIEDFDMDGVKPLPKKSLSKGNENDICGQPKISEDASSATSKEYSDLSVVFYDVEESYPNDMDIIISFTLGIPLPMLIDGTENEVSNSNMTYVTVNNFALISSSSNTSSC